MERGHSEGRSTVIGSGRGLPEGTATDPGPAAAEMEKLERRIGRIHLRQRLGIEAEHGTQVFGRGRNFFHIENWYSIHALIRFTLRSLGLYRRGVRNTTAVRIVHNEVALVNLPAAFEGFTLLQVSDLHLDMNPAFTDTLIQRLGQVNYDICVLTGDFRAKTFGDYRAATAELERVRVCINTPVYAILGNHDTIRMVPALEAMGIALLMNESVTIARDGVCIYLAGIDDPHYYQVDNLEKAAHDIPLDATSILLSHSPETYRLAAHAGFDLMLSGHTHGGQICLPGGIALMTNAACPRRLCAGAWRYHEMQGYTSMGLGTSVVEVRYNCPPEITLHRLRRRPTL